MEESKLALLIQEGRIQDPEVLSTLVHQYGGELMRHTRHALDDLIDLEPISLLLVQYTFHTLPTVANRIRDYSSLRTWLFWHHSRSLANMTSLAREAELDSKSARSSPERAFDPLSRFERQVMSLHHGHGFDLESLSVILKASESKIQKAIIAVRTKVARTRSIASDYPFHGKVHQAKAIRESKTALGQLQLSSEVQDHIATCVDCEAYANGIRAVDYWLAQQLASGLDFSPEAASQMTEAISQQDHIPAVQRRLPFREIVWMGTVLALFLLSIRGANTWIDSRRPTSTPQPTATILPATPLGEQLPNDSYYYEEAQRRSITDEALVLAGQYSPEIALATRPNLVIVDAGASFAIFAERTLLKYWDLGSGTITELDGHTEPIRSLEFWIDPQTFITADSAGQVYVWDLPEPAIRLRLDHPGPVESISVDHQNELLYVAHSQGIWVWEIDAERAVRTAVLSSDLFEQLAISGDGRYLAAAQSDLHITIFNVETALPILRFPAHEAEINRLAFMPASRWQLVSSSEDGTANFYNFTSTSSGGLRGGLIHAVPHPGPVRSLSVSGKDFAVTVSEGEVFVWNTELGLAAERSGSVLQEQSALGTSIDRTNGGLWIYAERGLLSGYFPEPRSDAEGSAPLTLVRNSANLARDPQLVHLISGQGWPMLNGELSTVQDAALTLSELLQQPIRAPGLTSSQFNYVAARYNLEQSAAVFEFQVTVSGQEERMPLILAQLPEGSVFTGVGNQAWIAPVQLGTVAADLALGSWQVRREDNHRLSDANSADADWYRWNPRLGLTLSWTEADQVFILHAPEVLDPDPISSNELDAMILLASSLIATNDLRLMIGHTVRPGETCTSIGARYGISVPHIELANGADSCAVILADEELLIPLSPSREHFADVDLDCDGIPERVSVLPDPETIGSFTNFGVSVAAIPAGLDIETGEYANVWELTIAHISVDFFGLPQLVNLPGECQIFLAISPFGGQEGQGGLDIYSWQDRTMQRILDTDAFLVSDLPGPNAAVTDFTVQKLVYDPERVTCDAVITRYGWTGSAFEVLSQDRDEGLECFGSP